MAVTGPPSGGGGVRSAGGVCGRPGHPARPPRTGDAAIVAGVVARRAHRGSRHRRRCPVGARRNACRGAPAAPAGVRGRMLGGGGAGRRPRRRLSVQDLPTSADGLREWRVLHLSGASLDSGKLPSLPLAGCAPRRARCAAGPGPATPGAARDGRADPRPARSHPPPVGRLPAAARSPAAARRPLASRRPPVARPRPSADASARPRPARLRSGRAGPGRPSGCSPAGGRSAWRGPGGGSAAGRS